MWPTRTQLRAIWPNWIKKLGFSRRTLSLRHETLGSPSSSPAANAAELSNLVISLREGRGLSVPAISTVAPSMSILLDGADQLSRGFSGMRSGPMPKD